MYEPSRPYASSVPSSISVDQALAYLNQGWSIIPVVLQTDAHGKIIKRPGVRWQEYQLRLPSRQEIRSWFGAGQYNGIGVITGKISALVVVDIEHEAAAEDEQDIQSPLESRTINGGRHVFYRWTQPVSNAVRIGGKPIDIRGDGGFVVLPPSRLGDKGYAWLKQADPQSLPPFPHPLETLISQPSVPYSQTATRIDTSGLSPQTAVYPTAHEGERNSTAAKVAGSLCANISPKLWEAVGWPALCHWNQTHCFPPLDSKELQQVWNSIAATHQRNHGDRQGSHKNDKQVPATAVPIIPWKAFSALQFKEPEWIIDSLIPKHGLVAVAGPPESCKSYFTTYLGITVSRGERLFDQFPSTQTSVLLIDQENLPAWIQQRLTQFQAELDLPLHIYADRSSPFNLEDQANFAQVIDYIDAHQIGLVILDTLRLSHNRDENSSTDMKPVFERLKALAQKAAVVFIQHHRKMERSQRDKVHGEDMMGSMLIRGSVDYQLSIIKTSDVADSVTQIKVSQTKARYTRNLPPFTLTLAESTTGLTFIYEGVAPKADFKLTSAKQAILVLLKPHPLTRQELMDRLTAEAICSPRTGDEALRHLRESGTIIRGDSRPHAYSLIRGAANPLKTSKTSPLQLATADPLTREKEVIHNRGELSHQPHPQTLQDCSGYIPVQPAMSDQSGCENEVFHNAQWDSHNIATLTNHQLQMDITRRKCWLLKHERTSPTQPAMNANGQLYDLIAWRRHLQYFCLLIDVAQGRGAARDSDWLEMARMIFHADNGITGRWAN